MLFEDGKSIVNSRIGTIPSTTNWKSIRLVALVVFLNRIQFTVYFASLYSMFQEMDEKFNPTFYGFVNAAYNAISGISAPVFGVIANKFGFRRPALFLCFVMLMSNLGYICTWNIPDDRRWFASMCRFLTGVAAGGSTILNSYWVTVAQTEDSSTAASYTETALSLGMACGPLVQLICSYVQGDNVFLGFLHISAYTVPAMIAIVAVSLSTLLIMKYLNEENNENTEDGSSYSDSSVGSSQEPLASLDYFAIFICFTIRSVREIVYANYETNNPSFMQWMFDYTPLESSKVGSALCSASGIIGFAFLVCYVWTGTSKRLNDRIGVLLGFITCILYLLGTFPWPSYDGFITHSYCIDTYTWCSTTTAIPLPIYVVSYFLMFSVGFPLLNVHTSSMLANKLAGRKQAHWHGLSKFVATVAQAASAPIMALALDHQGIKFTWYLQIGLVIFIILVILACYGKLGKPLRLPKFFKRILRKGELARRKNIELD